MRAIATCLLLLAACGAGEPVSTMLKVPQVFGLRRDANPQAKIPPGATRIAANCAAKRVGLLESRPGFVKSSNTHATIKPNRLLPWRELGSLLAVNADTTVAWWDALATPIKNEAAVNITMINPYFNRGAAARLNFYINAADGVRKLTSTTATTALRTGMNVTPLTYGVGVTGGSGYLADQYYVAYVAVGRRTDANNLIVRTAAIGNTVYRNLAGASRNTTVPVYISSSDFVAGDVIELYRTVSGAVIPDNEYFLVTEHVLTAAEVTAQTFTYTDVTEDDALGAAMYTNDSREGEEGANFAPPASADVAYFRESLFFSGSTGPKRYTLRWRDSQDCTGSATGIGYRTINGTRTNGSAVITMASTTGLEVGSMLSDGTTWSGTAPVIVTAVVANTSVTVGTTTWGGATDGGPVSLTWYDTIRVECAGLTGNNQYYPALRHQSFLAAMQQGNTLTRNIRNPTFYAFGADTYYYFGISIHQAATIAIEERLRGDANTSTLRATKPTEYSPAIAAMSAGSGTTIPADTLANAVWWSKTNEPEHVPLENFELVGADTAAVLRVIPTRDALWIFKTDGVWRLSGTSADSGWRIDPFDPTLKLLQPDAAVVYGDTVYAFTNRGFVAVSDAGVLDLDANAIANDLEGYIRKFSSFGNWKLGTWATADETSGFVLFGLASATAGTDPTSVIYCFNTNTKEFTTWETTTATVTVAGALASAVHMTFEPVSAKLVVAQSAADIATMRLDTDSPAYVTADYQFAVTISAIDASLLTTLGTKFTIAAASGWTPVVGDNVVRASVPCVVTSVVDATNFYVYASGAVTTGAATAYQAIYSGIEFTAQGDPTIEHQWLTANIAFQALNGMRQFDYSFITDRGAGVSTGKTKTVTYSAPSLTENTIAENPETVRLFVQRESARAPTVYPGFLIHQALSNWRMAGFTLFYNDTTERVGR